MKHSTLYYSHRHYHIIYTSYLLKSVSLGRAHLKGKSYIFCATHGPSGFFRGNQITSLNGAGLELPEDSSICVIRVLVVLVLSQPSHPVRVQ